jgi:hypothetical protein
MSDDGRLEGRVIQPSNDVNELLRLAEEGKASFESALQQVSRGMAGVSLVCWLADKSRTAAGLN